MDQETPALPLPTASARGWGVPLAMGAAAVVIAALGYGLMTLQETNQTILRQLAEVQANQAKTPVISTAHLQALEAIPHLAETVNQLPAPLAAQSQQITAQTAQLSTLTERLTTLEQATAERQEKAPKTNAALPQRFLALKATILRGEPFDDALAALTDYPEVTEAMTPLADMAETGIATESTLRTRLNILLRTAPVTDDGLEPHSLAARLNSQFAGMLHIRRTSATTIDTLRRHAEALSALPVLIADVKALPPAPSARFADWLTEAAARQRVDRILAEIETGITSPTGTP